jgi:hypothetical protein
MFVGLSPALFDLNITFEGKSVVALCFDTSRFPHVVKNPDHGTLQGIPELEVPWREGTRTRSATRNELILMLSPVVKIPKVEILDGDIRFVMMATDPVSHELRFNLKVYVVPLNATPLTFPFHKCTAILGANGQTISDKFTLTMDTPTRKLAKKQAAQAQKIRAASNYYETPAQVTVSTGNDIVETTADEVIFRGPGKIEIYGSYGVLGFDKLPELELTVTLVEAVSETNVLLSCKFSKRETNDKGVVWELNK